MSEKSSVGMGFHVCPVCGQKHDEVVLIDRMLRDRLTTNMFAGWSMCKDHQRLYDEGYIALIEAKNEPTGLNDADRTGQIAHVRKEAWPNIFNAPVPPKGICFVQVGVIADLQSRVRIAPKEST